MNRIPILVCASFLFISACRPNRFNSSLKNVYPKTMVVNVAVADIRSDQSRHNEKYEYDERQETQVLEGELVLVHGRQGKWARVECLEQMEYTHNSKWEGYPGWMLYSELSDDVTKQKFPLFLSIDEKAKREYLLNEARRHVGSRYLWGGRSLFSSFNKYVLTGVDCSGLVNWSFRQIGMKVPRDAHEQYMKAVRLNPHQIRPGDLLFLAKKDNPQKIVHVAFVSSSETLLEAPQSGDAVREITFTERFGKNLRELKNGDVVENRVIYFGTLLSGGI